MIIINYQLGVASDKIIKDAANFDQLNIRYGMTRILTIVQLVRLCKTI